MNGKEREKEYVREMAFAKKCGVVLIHHHDDFFNTL